MPESQHLFFGLRLMSRIFGEFQNIAALWLIFSTNKVRSQYDERILYKPWSEQAGGWIHFCMKRLKTFKSFQIFKTEINRSKTCSSWCPSQGLSNGMVPLSCRSNLAGRYLNNYPTPAKGISKIVWLFEPLYFFWVESAQRLIKCSGTQHGLVGTPFRIVFGSLYIHWS